MSGKGREFLSTQLSELSRFAPEEKHRDEWAAITRPDALEKPMTCMKAIYALVCQYTRKRLSAEVAATLDRGVRAEQAEK